MTEKNNANEDVSDRELVFTRIFDAPRELVFEAWTDPKHLIQWWGPNGFTNTIHEINVPTVDAFFLNVRNQKFCLLTYH